mgnify:CR=1 FL=1
MYFAGILVLLSAGMGAVASAQGLARDGPWNHRVLLATSADGRNWTVQPQILAERASVPELFLDPGGRPTLLFVDAGGLREGIGAMQREEDGSWRRVETNLRDVDPNVVRLADGSYRAYVKSGLDGAISAYNSPDGLHWTPLGEVFRDARFPNATDPDVFETPDGWVMLLSLGPRLLRCASPDGLRFTTGGSVLDLGGSVSDTVKVPGGWRTFFHSNADPRTGSRMRIRSAFTADGTTWQVEEGDRLVAPPEGPASLGVADPAPVELPGGDWLMAFKSFLSPPGPPAPPPQGGGIETHVVGSATSADGLAWTRDEGVRISRASVPAAINDNDGRILLYYVKPPDEPGRPETVACAVSTDGLRFEPETGFRIDGFSALKAVDPSIVRDEDGRFRLYYLASNHPGGPAAGPNPHAIHLALSDDGLRFQESGPVFEYPGLVDPDVFRFAGQWWMYVFAGDGTVIARSADGLRFAYEGVLALPGWGTTAPVALPDGRLRLYAFDQKTSAGNTVCSFVSQDGMQWTAEEEVRLAAAPDEQITDPYVIPWRGGYKMYFKITPRRAQFATGQAADVVLGAKGFNDSGGPLLFNHPSGPATGGRSLLPADRWNNRVLIWKAAPLEGHDVRLWKVEALVRDHQAARIGPPGLLNLPGDALAADGRLFVADRNNNRVVVWNRVPDAIDGRAPDAYLGAARADDRTAGMSERKLFMPGSLAWDGENLRVGEFKFSTRILRFPPRPAGGPVPGANSR